MLEIFHDVLIKEKGLPFPRFSSTTVHQLLATLVILMPVVLVVAVLHGSLVKLLQLARLLRILLEQVGLARCGLRLDWHHLLYVVILRLSHGMRSPSRSRPL